MLQFYIESATALSDYYDDELQEFPVFVGQQNSTYSA